MCTWNEHVFHAMLEGGNVCMCGLYGRDLFGLVRLYPDKPERYGYEEERDAESE